VIRRELSERLLDYGVHVIKVVEAMPGTLTGRRIGDQLLRCGTSVGANYEEAQAAESKADFVHKLQLSLKELRESNYWLLLLSKAKTLPPNQLEELINESHQLRAIFSKAVATAKGRAKCLPPSHF
jgi:four helix bundle protein